MIQPEEYHTQLTELSGLQINITSYKIGGQYHCHIDNVDPGATIVRTHGLTREEAERTALARALQRLKSRTK
jgi:hypothetical protein